MTKTQHQQFKDRLHKAGYKFTQPRQQVAAVLLESDSHLSAPEIVDLVSEKDTSIGRMSVYRTLDLYTRLGFIRPAFQEGPNARYIVVLDGHHHHLVCQKCGRVVHFDELPCPVAELEQELATQYGFSIKGHLLEFFGICEECRP